MLDRGGMAGPAGRRDTWEDWGSVSKALHWLSAALVPGLFATGLVLSRLTERDPDFSFWFGAHAAAGILILMLTLVRLGWRRRNRRPVLPDTLSPIQRRIARLTHLSFYVLLILVPLAGWFAIDFLAVPGLVGDQPGTARILLAAHVAGAGVLAGLIGVHILAALRHEFVLKDRVLRRMLPLPARLQRWPAHEGANPPTTVETPATSPQRSPHRP